MKKIVIEVTEEGINLDYDMPRHEFLGVLHSLLLHENAETMKPIVFKFIDEFEQSTKVNTLTENE